jgi:DNA-binding transcriptional LysR family regulator
MDIRLLRSFVAVAGELSFRRAAERLHIAQPALSRQVSLLESELGGKLFERTKRRVTLTRAGERFLEEARSVLAQFDHAAAVGRNVMSGRDGFLRVAINSTSVFNPRTAELLNAYRTQWPRIALDLQEVTGSLQFAAAEEDRIDLGFLHIDTDVLRDSKRLWPRLHLEVLAREGVVAAVSIGHRLAGRRSVKLSELLGEAFLKHARQEYGGPYQRLERLRGSPVRVAQEVLNIGAMVHLAGAGLGVALLPESMKSIQAPRVRYLPVSDEKQSRVLALVYAADTSRPTVQNFLKLAVR